LDKDKLKDKVNNKVKNKVKVKISKVVVVEVDGNVVVVLQEAYSWFLFVHLGHFCGLIFNFSKFFFFSINFIWVILVWVIFFYLKNLK